MAQVTITIKDETALNIVAALDDCIMDYQYDTESQHKYEAWLDAKSDFEGALDKVAEEELAKENT